MDSLNSIRHIKRRDINVPKVIAKYKEKEYNQTHSMKKELLCTEPV
jgi:hypothetical protein